MEHVLSLKSWQIYLPKSTRTIRDWILAYQNGGIEALCPVTANHSYSKEFKLEMIQRYIAGEGSVRGIM